MSRWSRWDRGDRWDRGGWYPKPKPKRPPPERGIKVGKIGTTWWGVRWIEALERMSSMYSNRLARGRTYARAGRVHDLEVKPGLVTARVTGSRATPYKIDLRIAVLNERAWGKATAAMAEQAVFAAELLSGTMPKEIEQAFQAAGTSLFPVREKDLMTECSCPDYANPCKHIAATHFVLGEAFDKDPFLLFELRGRKREEVLGALRKLRAAGDGSSAASAEVAAVESISSVSIAERSAADYERLAAPLGHFRFDFEPALSPAALLRQLGTPGSWRANEAPVELFTPLYSAASRRARELASGAAGDSTRNPEPADAPRKRRQRPDARR